MCVLKLTARRIVVGLCIEITQALLARPGEGIACSRGWTFRSLAMKFFSSIIVYLYARPNYLVMLDAGQSKTEGCDWLEGSQSDECKFSERFMRNQNQM